jgi:SnoaL-like domain
MTDFAAIADRYIALWNERDDKKRADILAANWVREATYVDPLMEGKGTKTIGDLIGGVQQKFPDFHFHLIGKADGFGNNVRFSWGAGLKGENSIVEGTDFAALENGKIKSITGFLDKVPAQ